MSTDRLARLRQLYKNEVEYDAEKGQQAGITCETTNNKLDSQARAAIAGEMQRVVKDLRWLRDAVEDCHEDGVADLDALDVAAMLLLVPALTGAMTKLAKALGGEPAPKGRKRK